MNHECMMGVLVLWASFSIHPRLIIHPPHASSYPLIAGGKRVLVVPSTFDAGLSGAFTLRACVAAGGAPGLRPTLRPMNPSELYSSVAVAGVCVGVCG